MSAEIIIIAVLAVVILCSTTFDRVATVRSKHKKTEEATTSENTAETSYNDTPKQDPYENFGYVMATKCLVEGKQRVHFAYREAPDNNIDSGWRFFCGDEDDTYVNNPDNIGIYDIKTILEIDNEIESLLDAEVGVAFEDIKGVWCKRPLRESIHRDIPIEEVEEEYGVVESEPTSEQS